MSLSWKKIESWAMISCQFLVRIVQRFSASATARYNALNKAINVASIFAEAPDAYTPLPGPGPRKKADRAR